MKQVLLSILFFVILCVAVFFSSVAANAQEETSTVIAMSCKEFDDAKKIVDSVTDSATSIIDSLNIFTALEESKRCGRQRITIPSSLSRDDLEYYQQRGLQIVAVISVKQKDGKIFHAVINTKARTEKVPEEDDLQDIPGSEIV